MTVTISGLGQGSALRSELLMDPTLAARALSAATEITSTALSGDDPEGVLETVVARAVELADADLGLAMVSADDGRVVVEAAYGVDGFLAEAPTGDVDGGPVGELRGLTLGTDSAAGQVARGSEPIAAEDFIVDPRTAPYVPDELRGYGPFAAAPFGSGGRVLGALTVYRRQGREPFSAGTVEMLAAFAAQAGVVLALAEGANARHRVTLYQERERIARELHDVIVQRLYGTGMQLDRVRRNMRKRFAQADGARLSDAIDQLDQTIEEIRGTVRALRSPEPRHDPGSPTDLAESARGEVRIMRRTARVSADPGAVRRVRRHPGRTGRPHPCRTARGTVQCGPSLRCERNPRDADPRLRGSEASRARQRLRGSARGRDPGASASRRTC